MNKYVCLYVFITSNAQAQKQQNGYDGFTLKSKPFYKGAQKNKHHILTTLISFLSALHVISRNLDHINGHVEHMKH